MAYCDIEIDARLSFEEFMLMPSNSLAHAAARGIAEGKVENTPLCVFSEVGCGKTHLLNAIGIRYLELNPNKKVVRTSVVRMIENYISALQGAGMTDFRSHYRMADMLLIDDLEALEKPKQFQEEMFNTLNELLAARKLVAFASVSSPLRMSISERIVALIASGLTVKIDGLTKGERFEFLKNQFVKAGVSILDSHVTLIADAIRGNAADLVRAVRAVKFVSAENGYEATRTNVRTALESCGVIK